MQDKDGDEQLGVWSEFGSALGRAVASASEPATGFGDRPDGQGGDLDGLPAVTGLGDVPSSVGSSLGASVLGATAKATDLPAPKGYHNRVDADGDGHLDKATYRGNINGGADILVDIDGDGRTDFIGHDTDLDNRVDYADYDKDGDGIFEKRMFDHDGDGYLD
jgi:hypothetical protein